MAHRKCRMPEIEPPAFHTAVQHLRINEWLSSNLRVAPRKVMCSSVQDSVHLNQEEQRCNVGPPLTHPGTDFERVRVHSIDEKTYLEGLGADRLQQRK